MIRLYVFWLLGLICLTIIGSYLLPLNANSGLGAISQNQQFNYFLSLAQWDGGHYFEIAQNGYANQQSYAFMPLFPLLIKIVSSLTENHILSGLIISNISAVSCLFLLQAYFKKLNPRSANTAILIFLFFPTTFFTALVYSEAIFILIIVTCFLLLENGKFKESLILSSLAPITRVAGVFLPASIIMSKIKINFPAKAAILIACYIPLLVFYFLSFQATDNFLTPLSAQRFWNRELSNPLTTVFSYLFAFVSQNPKPLNDYFDFAGTLFSLTILFLGIKKIPFYLFFFSVSIIILPTFTSTLTSMPRYVLPAIGVYIILAEYLNNKKKVRALYIGTSLALQATLASLFINGHWVA